MKSKIYNQKYPGVAHDDLLEPGVVHHMLPSPLLLPLLLLPQHSLSFLSSWTWKGREEWSMEEWRGCYTRVQDSTSVNFMHRLVLQKLQAQPSAKHPPHPEEERKVKSEHSVCQLAAHTYLKPCTEMQRCCHSLHCNPLGSFLEVSLG